MKLVIDYDPTPDEIRLHLRKAHAAAIRSRFAILADHEVRKTRDEIDRKIAQAIADGKDLDSVAADIFTKYGPDSIEA